MNVPDSSTTIPVPHDVGHAFEDLANLCDWVLVSHDDQSSKQRVTVLYKGRVFSQASTFVGAAALQVQNEILSA
jgi:hypothetical protein